MNDQEAQRMRDAITRDQVACRCGHLLAACADCRDWLSENSPQIQNAWAWWWRYALDLQMVEHGVTWGADAAEADDLAYFESGR